MADNFVTKNRWPQPITADTPIDYPVAGGESLRVVEREPGSIPTDSSGSRTNTGPLDNIMGVVSGTEEREPGLTIARSDDGNGATGSPGSRDRFVAMRGSGSAGTAYNEHWYWEVYDRDRIAGRQLMCRATFEDAAAIVVALNAAFPSIPR